MGTFPSCSFNLPIKKTGNRVPVFFFMHQPTSRLGSGVDASRSAEPDAFQGDSFKMCW